jgi:hypothetical protein
MATLKQYEFFNSLYDEESARTDELHGYGKTYLSLATFYSAFVAFVVEKLRPDTTATKILFLATVVCMLGAFFISLWSMKVSNFEAVTTPRDVIDQFDEDEPMTDEEFFDNRIADYVVAYERNSVVNDRKARQVEIAGYAILMGIFLHACYITVRIN